MGGIARALTESGWDWKGLPALLVDKLTAEPCLRVETTYGCVLILIPPRFRS